MRFSSRLLLSYRILTLSADELRIPSLPSRGLFVSKEGWGEKKKKKERGGRWEWEREEARVAPSFPSSHARLLFSIVALYLIGIPNGSFWTGERVLPRIHPQSLFLFRRFQETKKENIGTSLHKLKEGITTRL